MQLFSDCKQYQEYGKKEGKNPLVRLMYRGRRISCYLLKQTPQSTWIFYT